MVNASSSFALAVEKGALGSATDLIVAVYSAAASIKESLIKERDVIHEEGAGLTDDFSPPPQSYHHVTANWTVLMWPHFCKGNIMGNKIAL